MKKIESRSPNHINIMSSTANNQIVTSLKCVCRQYSGLFGQNDIWAQRPSDAVWKDTCMEMARDPAIINWAQAVKYNSIPPGFEDIDLNGIITDDNYMR